MMLGPQATFTRSASDGLDRDNQTSVLLEVILQCSPCTNKHISFLIGLRPTALSSPPKVSPHLLEPPSCSWEWVGRHNKL